MPPDNAVVFKRKLSDALIRSLTEPGKHADGEVPGLYLEMRASSKVGKSPSKVWRLKYRLHGKENRFSIGATPTLVSRRRATLPAAHAAMWLTTPPR